MPVTKTGAVQDVIAWVVVAPDGLPLLQTADRDKEQCLNSAVPGGEFGRPWEQLQAEGYTCQKLWFISVKMKG